MVVLGVLLGVATARGDRGEPEEGEDIDLSVRPDMVTVLKLVAHPGVQHRHDRLPRLGHHRCHPVRRLRLGSRQQDAAARHRRSASCSRSGRGTSSTPVSTSRSRPASSTGSSEMDSLELLWGGLEAAFTPTNLMYAVIGVMLGTFVGVLPGIGPAMAVALLLPVTNGMEPTQAFIMFAGIYYGGMYGGSTTSILLNTPGRVGVGDDRHRGQQDGEEGPSRAGTRDGRHRLVRRRHDRHAVRGVLRPGDGEGRGEGRRPVVLRDDAAGGRAGHQRARAPRSCAGSSPCSSA